MAGKSTVMNKKQKKAKTVKEQKVNRQQKSNVKFSGKYVWVVAILAFLVFTPLFNQEFINYDDDWMIYENPYVTGFSPQTIKMVFSDFYFGQYSPVSMVIIGMVHHLGGGEVLPFKIAGFFIHLINAFLVFLLLKNIFQDKRIALVGMAFFAIHPVQVESVAWLSASFKVGIFAMFSLASLYCWERFTILRKYLYYFGALLFMVVACFAKEQALVLPLFMLLISWYNKIRIFSLKNLLHYLPFLLVSLVFVIVTYLAVSSRTEVQLQQYTFGQRVYYLTYSFIEYFRLLLFPVNLSLFYGIPNASTFEKVAFPLLTAGLIFFCYRLSRSHREVAFALLFVLISLILTFALQLVALRESLHADRYLYLAVPMFYIAVMLIAEKRFRFNLNIPLLVLLIVFSGLSFLRAQKFENSEVLWTDAIENGYKNPLAYNNRGHYYRQQNKAALALRDYEEALKINPRYFRTLNNRGKILFDQGQVDVAMEDFNKALSIAPDFVSALSNRGAAFAAKGNFEAALTDLDKAIRLDSTDKNAYSNRALVYYYTNRFGDAIRDVNRYLVLVPGDADMHNLRALAYRQDDQLDKAMEDFNAAITLNASQGAFYQNRSFLWFAMGNLPEAHKDILRAQQLGVTVDPGYLARVAPNQ
jgi:protein O-mannosyl-transferase